MKNDHNEGPQLDKPESFQNLELMARTLFAVPKAEVDALEKQEKKDKKQYAGAPDPALAADWATAPAPPP